MHYVIITSLYDMVIIRGYVDSLDPTPPGGGSRTRCPYVIKYTLDSLQRWFYYDASWKAPEPMCSLEGIHSNLEFNFTRFRIIEMVLL